MGKLKSQREIIEIISILSQLLETNLDGEMKNIISTKLKEYINYL